MSGQRWKAPTSLIGRPIHRAIEGADRLALRASDAEVQCSKAARELQDLGKSCPPKTKIPRHATMVKAVTPLVDNAVKERRPSEEARAGSIGKAVQKPIVAVDDSTGVRRWQATAKIVVEAPMQGEQTSTPAEEQDIPGRSEWEPGLQLAEQTGLG